MLFALAPLSDAAGPVPQLALATLSARGVASPGHPPGLLHLDCSALPYQCSLGVCHQVSQLLLLRRAGVEVWLHHVNPVLAHSLHKLKVAHLFAWAT